MASAAPASCQFSVLQSSFPSLPKLSSVKNGITCRSGLQHTRECKQCCLAAKGCTPNSWGACLRSHTEMSRSTATVSSSRKVAALPDNGGSDSRSLSTSSYESGVPGMQLPLLRWKRVLLKVSGEALLGDGAQNIDPKFYLYVTGFPNAQGMTAIKGLPRWEVCGSHCIRVHQHVTMSIANEVAAITRLGVQVGIVVGGGNFFRGANWVGSSGLDRGSADHIGMMATVMNAIFLQASLESVGIPTRVQTAFRMAEVAEPYIRRRAIRHLEKGRVVIFGAGTGNPFFTTDTAAALRAAEIDAEVVLKATNVDGVYDSDPKTNKAARLLHHVSYSDVAVKRLSVMDITAITLCQENHIPVVVFNLSKEGNIAKAISGSELEH